MKNLLLFAALLCVLISCTPKEIDYSYLRNTPQSLLHDVKGPVIQLDSIPLKVGNEWTYTLSGYDSNYSERIRVVADTLINGEKVSKVNTTVDTSVSTSYYTNRKDGYYLVGYESSNPDTIVIYSPAHHLVSFPIAINATWTIPDIDTFNIQYQWLDFDIVTTPAGTFNCCKLTHVNHYGLPIYYDYYSSKGLVKEVCIIAGSGGPGVSPVYSLDGNTILTSVNF